MSFMEEKCEEETCARQQVRKDRAIERERRGGVRG